jgi:hypothetical protein
MACSAFPRRNHGVQSPNELQPRKVSGLFLLAVCEKSYLPPRSPRYPYYDTSLGIFPSGGELFGSPSDGFTSAPRLMQPTILRLLRFGTDGTRFRQGLRPRARGVLIRNKLHPRHMETAVKTIDQPSCDPGGAPNLNPAAVWGPRSSVPPRRHQHATLNQPSHSCPTMTCR